MKRVLASSMDKNFEEDCEFLVADMGDGYFKFDTWKEALEEADWRRQYGDDDWYCTTIYEKIGDGKYTIVAKIWQ